MRTSQNLESPQYAHSADLYHASAKSHRRQIGRWSLPSQENFMQGTPASSARTAVAVGRRRPCHPAPPWWCCPAPPEDLPPTVGAPLPEVAVRSQVVAVREGQVWDNRNRESTTRGGLVRYFALSSCFLLCVRVKGGWGPYRVLAARAAWRLALKISARRQARAGEAHRLSGTVSFRFGFALVYSRAIFLCPPG